MTDVPAAGTDAARPCGDEPYAVALRRLRWRARRGMLENDLLLTRFFDSLPDRLDASEIGAIERLLELPDGEFLDLLLGRIALPVHLQGPAERQALARLQAS